MDEGTTMERPTDCDGIPLTPADEIRYLMAEASCSDLSRAEWLDVLDALDRFEALARHRANRASRRQRAPMPESVRAFLEARGLA